MKVAFYYVKKIHLNIQYLFLQTCQTELQKCQVESHTPAFSIGLIKQTAGNDDGYFYDVCTSQLALIIFIQIGFFCKLYKKKTFF